MATFTFGAAPTVITFALLLERPEHSREAQVSVRHIPGGDTNYIDIAGKQATYIRGRGKFNSFADFVAMRDNVGISGTLAYTESTYTVYLTRVSRQKVDGRGSGVHITDIEFVVSQ